MSNKERGMTLVELLATIAIVSIVVLFIVGIQIVVQKQFKDQTRKTEQLTDVTIAMKSITKELRLAEDVAIENDHHLIIKINPEENITYSLENNILKKNNSNYIYDVKQFFVEKIEEDKVFILIESETGKKLDTEIMLRRE